MPIRLHAEGSGDGVLLSGFASFEELSQFRDFLLQKGLNPGAASIPSQQVFLAYLPKISLHDIAGLIEGANVELVPPTIACGERSGNSPHFPDNLGGYAVSRQEAV